MSDTPRLRRSGDPRTPTQAVQPVTAALTPEGVGAGPSSMLRRRGKPMPWQEKVKDYDRNGPGIAGYYLDTVALMASLCPLYVSVRTPSGDWERSDDPILQVALDAWKGTLMSQPDLVFHAVRGRESLGRVWNIKDPETGHNVVSQITNLDDNRVGWRDLYGRPRITPIFAADGSVLVWRSWYPDPYEMWEPTSPMRRALPNLRRLRSNVRNQTRAFDSRMTTNGILNFPIDPASAASRPFDGIDGPQQGTGGPQGVPQEIRDYMELAKLAHEDDEGVAAMVPFPRVGTPAVWTAVGREIDMGALEGERVALEGFARDVNFPQQLLTFGPGSANHWNEFLMQETAVKLSLAPKLQPVCNDVLVFHLIPMIHRFRSSLTEWRRSVDPRHVKIEFDLSFLLRRPSQVMELFRAYELGIATREQVAEELGLKGDLLAIPNGMSAYEHWELATPGKGAPYAEVDREGNLIVPDPAAMGGAPPMDPAALPGAPLPADPAAAGAPSVDAGAGMAQALGLPPTPGQTVTEPAPPSVVAALPPVRWSAAKAQSVREMRAIAAAEAAESPPDADPDHSAVVVASVTAALTDTEAEDPEVVAARKLFADAANADVRLSAELAGLLAALAAEVEREVARRVIIAHEPRSEIRAKLGRLPLGQVWQAADPEVKARFPLEETVNEVVARFEPQVQAAYEEAAQGFLERWGGVIAAVVVLAAIGAAVKSFSSGFEGWAIDRYRPRRAEAPSAARMRAGRPSVPTRDPNGPSGLGMRTLTGESAVPPTMIVRDSMIVAGGAEPGRGNDLPVRDAGGNPTPTTGGPWRGGTGFLTGHNVVAAAPARPVRWRWRHAFIRRPKVPYPPHENLDGDVFDRPGDVPGGFFPSDHPFCSCAMLPEV